MDDRPSGAEDTLRADFGKVSRRRSFCSRFLAAPRVVSLAMDSSPEAGISGSLVEYLIALYSSGGQPVIEAQAHINGEPSRSLPSCIGELHEPRNTVRATTSVGIGSLYMIDQ